MRKKLIPAFLIAILASGCFVQTRGGRRCPRGMRPTGTGACERTPTRREPPPDKVIIRDHRR